MSEGAELLARALAFAALFLGALVASAYLWPPWIDPAQGPRAVVLIGPAYALGLGVLLWKRRGG